MGQFITTGVLSFLLVYLIKVFAFKLGFIDEPNERSSHVKVTPRAGGIGFILAFFIGLLIFQTKIVISDFYIFVSIFIIFFTGVIDDKYEVSARYKFIAIFVATFLLWYYGVSIQTLGEWGSYEIKLPSLVSLLFTMFAVAGFTNALNLSDGLDGLSTSISLVILATFYFIGYDYHDDMIMTLSYFMIAALSGFLLLNWNPAKIFMGDSGSLSLGFVISILAILSIKYIHPVTILYIASLPILDTLIVMIRRIRKGYSPFKPDKTHIHHIMLKFFENDVKKTVLFLLVLQGIFSVIGYLLANALNQDENSMMVFSSLGVFIMMFLLFYMIFTGIHRKQKSLDRFSK